MRLAVFLLFGLIAGAVICLVAPGRAPRAWIESMVVGAAGSMVGGLFASALGWNGESDRKGYIVSLLVALAWVGIYRLVRRRHERTSSKAGGLRAGGDRRHGDRRRRA